MRKQAYDYLETNDRQLNEKYKLFKKGQTVVDLGYAPGSWSQVAHDRTSPNGRVIGIDILPVQPPKGVSTIQGNFLSPLVQQQVRDYVRNGDSGRSYPATEKLMTTAENEENGTKHMTEEDLITVEKSILEPEMAQEQEDKVVDVVLSDMSAPWDQTTGFWKRSLSDPYRRMMNTSGVNFRDHIGSMELCEAALDFAYETLKPGGSFVCKFFQGAEDKAFEKKLKALFAKVHREKPESSRSESRENFFVALRRKDGVSKGTVFTAV
ncbi:MAG: hypothetical protein GOMPHAMPRED_006728 [Gomphillus americanus]|uniref:rRNA methyltransferase 2, mitochondrial n=1 Tax=Gomphillus americanus TaxID=1940652 RepID=A0A8H3ID94_9LECA|nr:MAG: hypothetical protein GOMPHAMPRED_006728 [Gomphillus americanus]